MNVTCQSRGRTVGRGYTLIELLAVMVVLGILAMAAFPLSELAVQRDRERELKRALWEIRDAIDAYKRAADSGLIARIDGTSGYPPNLQALVDGASNPKEAGHRIHFLRRLPQDPFSDPSTLPERAWGLRSFQSPLDRPEAGADVYDVFSQSGRVGLNGVPLRDW